jgi:hypothetical protein
LTFLLRFWLVEPLRFHGILCQSCLYRTNQYDSDPPFVALDGGWIWTLPKDALTEAEYDQQGDG